LPVLAVGLDSFDTAFAGCTTHLASVLALRLAQEGYRLLDYPWLVRLNPAAPWKTRGNAAVAILLQAETWSEAEKAARLALDTARAYAGGTGPGKESLIALLLEEAESLSDYTALRPRCLRGLYHRAVHELAPIEQAQECLEEIAPLILASYGTNNRGIVGALSALGYEPAGDYTFELLVYRKPRYWLKERRIDPESVLDYDIRYRPMTFMNYDYEENRALIAPHGYDPVLYGVRGEEPEPLLRALDTIDTGGEEPSHWMLFRSNQATGAHLRPKPLAAVRPYDNPLVRAVITGPPRRLPGGHAVAAAADHTGVIHLAAYRETGRLRRVLSSLRPGDEVVAAGSAKLRAGVLTLNLELLWSPGLDWPPAGPCGAVQPPVSRLSHLSVPPERCRRGLGGKRLRQPATIHLPKEFTLE
jgi:tRNA(Ile2)-agmatinylcytidine synthase